MTQCRCRLGLLPVIVRKPSMKWGRGLSETGTALCPFGYATRRRGIEYDRGADEIRLPPRVPPSPPDRSFSLTPPKRSGCFPESLCEKSTFRLRQPGNPA